MALNGTLLGDQILAAIDVTVAGNAQVSEAQRQAVWRAIGNAIVLHFQTNAVVPVTVVSVTAVTAGVGVSGPGTGTGTIT